MEIEGKNKDEEPEEDIDGNNKDKIIQVIQGENDKFTINKMFVNVNDETLIKSLDLFKNKCSQTVSSFNEFIERYKDDSSVKLNI